jgi:hypothetical protein
VCSSLNARDQVSYPCRTSGTIIISYISIYPVVAGIKEQSHCNPCMS